MKRAITLIVAAIAVMAIFAVPRWRQAQRAKDSDDYFEQQFGPLGKTADAILSHESTTQPYTVLGALRYRISQKAEARGQQNLTDTERRLMASFWVEAEVDNGGFDQYFFNSSGDDAEVALAGLEEMGATGAAALLGRAMAVFPGGKPPADRSKRQEVMEQIAAKSKPVWNQCDDEFYKLKENISDLSLAYAKKKRAEIILP